MRHKEAFEIHSRIREQFATLAMKLSKRHALYCDIVANIGIAELMLMNSAIATARELDDGEVTE